MGVCNPTEMDCDIEAEYAEYEAIEMELMELPLFDRLPDDVRLMIVSHLSFTQKLTAMETCRAMCAVTNEGEVGQHLKRVREDFLETKEHRDQEDSQQVQDFFFGLCKMLVLTLLSLGLIGGLGLYCWYYGELYSERACDYPLARDLRQYGRRALQMWGMLLLMQCGAQSQLIYRLVPQCFKRPRGTQFFDLETGEAIQETEHHWRWESPYRNNILLICALVFFCVLWVTAVAAVWNLVHVYYYVIYSETCDQELYDAAYFFAMIPVCAYVVLCLFQSCVFGFLMAR